MNESYIFFQNGLLSLSSPTWGVCSSPNDPSYRSLLGSGTTDCSRVDLIYKPNQACKWKCQPGWHLEPSDPEAQKALRCSIDSLWVDDAADGISRCMLNHINCTFPLIDEDDESCSLPQPIVTRVIGADFNPGSQGGCVKNLNNRTSGCSSDVGAILTVVGEYFTQPLRVYVGEYECENPVLMDEDESLVCTNDTTNTNGFCHIITTCYRYSSRLRCHLPAGTGTHLPLVVMSYGKLSDPLTSAVAFSEPQLSVLCAIGCSNDIIGRIRGCPYDLHNLTYDTSAFQPRLIHCPYDTDIELTIVGSDFGSVADGLSSASATVGNIPCLINSFVENIGNPLNKFAVAIKCVVPGHRSYGTDVPVLFTQAIGVSNSLKHPVTISFRSCPPGSFFRGYNDTNEIICELCSPGTYYDPPDIDGVKEVLSCDVCPLGSYAGGAGSTRCDKCSAGTIPIFNDSTVYNATNCTVCPPGSYSTEGSIQCTSCSPGRFASEFGSSECEECPAGSMASYNSSLPYNATECSLCTPGSWSEKESIQCNPCLAGTASFEEGRNSTCTECLPQFYSAVAGASSCSHCPANSKQTAAGQVDCEYCSDNSYLVVKDYTCLACPSTSSPGSLSNCSTNGIIIAAPGTWLVILLFNRLQDPFGMYSSARNLRLNNSLLCLIRLFVDQESGIVESYDCIRPSACFNNKAVNTSVLNSSGILIQSSNIKVYTVCEEGRIVAKNNVLCSRCLPEHSEWNGVCVFCTEGNAGLICLIIFFLFFLVYALHRLPHDNSSFVSILSYYLQMSALFFSGESIMAFLHLFNFDLISSIPFSACVMPLNPNQILVTKLFLPFAALPCLLLIYLVELGLRSSKMVRHTKLLHLLFPTVQPVRPYSTGQAEVQGAKSYNILYIRTIVFLSLLSYTIITSATLTFFSCRAVGNDIVLATVPAITCYDHTYFYMLPLFLSALILVVLGLPAALGIFIWYNGKAIQRILEVKHPPFNKLNHPPSPFNGLDKMDETSEFEEKDETVEESIILSTLSAPLIRPSSNSSEFDLFSSKHNFPSLNSDSSLSFADNIFAQRYGILFARYRPIARYHQPYLLIIRTSLLAVGAIITSPTLRATVWTTINVICLTIHALIQPRLTKTENICELLIFAAHTLQTAILSSFVLPTTNIIQA